MALKRATFFTLFVIIHFVISESLFAQQADDTFFSITTKGIEKYTVKRDTLTIEIDNLRLFPRRIDLEEKDIIIKKQIKGNYETWYLKLLKGPYVREGDFKLLLFQHNGNKNMFGSFISRTYPTIELCEYALLPDPLAIYYVTCYTKTYFYTFQHFPSFADADEQTARAVFEHLKTQMDQFTKEKILWKNYRSIAYQNFMNEAMLRYNFDPAVDQKSLNYVMTKYHIK